MEKWLFYTMTQFNLISLNASMLSFLSKDELFLRRDSSTAVQNILKGNQQKFLNLTQRFEFFPVSSCSNSIAFISHIFQCPCLGCSVNFYCNKISVTCYSKCDPILHTTRVQKQDMKLEMIFKINIVSE